MHTPTPLLSPAYDSASQHVSPEDADFMQQWTFARSGPMPDGSELAEPEGVESDSYDDSGWRTLNLPHDWGIEGPFRMDLPGATGKLPWAGIGWYRKRFHSPSTDQGKRVYLDFDGAMSRTTVFLNGHPVGHWPYGYSSFRFDLTPFLKVGEENLLTVRLDNKPDSSRWYPGGGIYRHLHLVKKSPVHVAQWGVCVTTPAVTADSATVKVVTTLTGDTGGTHVHQHITRLDSDEVLAEAEGTSVALELEHPQLWDIQDPNLYQLHTRVLEQGKEVDSTITLFGVRTIGYVADKGFLLNGRVLKMNGACMHHDLGPLGTAVHVRALERQIDILKRFGVNAIRTSHNPPAPELLTLCDRMGVLVQVEAFDCWEENKNINDYGSDFNAWHERDLVAMVHRDRNHPSVVMWSSGNEIKEFRDADKIDLSEALTSIIRREDPTRPVTFGANYAETGRNGFQHSVDLMGYNYKPHLYAEFRADYPNIPLFGSETASTVSSRGEYVFPVSDDKAKGLNSRFHVSSYDLSAPNWAMPPDTEFEAQDRHPEVFGEFVWTGFDYLGEPTPYNKDPTNLNNYADPEEAKQAKAELDLLDGNLPSRSSYFGIVDLCGFPKDRFYLYQSKWCPDMPMAYILPHWNWPERIGEVTPVHVYTTGDEAELFLNGVSLGRQKREAFQYRFRWDDVRYEPGELKVVTYKNGEPWATQTSCTTGEPSDLSMEADRSVIRSDGRDLSFITVRIIDDQGLTVPRTHHPVRYSISGPGKVIAIGNGDPTSHEPFQAMERKVFNGLALVVVQSETGKPGTLELTASSDGLTSNMIRIETRSYP